jgi:hypothetical protein
MLDDDGSTRETLRRHLRIVAGLHLHIAIVGNGGLSEDQRKHISSSAFDHVVRFNDMKNMRVGERTTLHAVRYRVDAWDGPYSGLSCYMRNAPLLLVGEDDNGRFPANGPGTFPCPDGARYEIAATLSTRVKVLPGLSDAAPVSTARYGPSTGLYVIALFHSMAEVSEIHTFGMNWSFGDPMRAHGHSPEEGSIVARHCKKVTVHTTPTSEYEPPSMAYLHRSRPGAAATCPDPSVPPRRGGVRGISGMGMGAQRVVFRRK